MVVYKAKKKLNIPVSLSKLFDLQMCSFLFNKFLFALIIVCYIVSENVDAAIRSTRLSVRNKIVQVIEQNEIY